MERIRLRSAGFLSYNYITSTSALVAVIVDCAFQFNIQVYSVDTRAWKAQVLGSSKSTGKNKKDTSKAFIESLGFEVGNDDDKCDAACISLYGFIPEKLQKLKLET